MIEHELCAALNRASAEGASDTPDFILAAFLHDALKAWNRACLARDVHYIGQEHRGEALDETFADFTVEMWNAWRRGCKARDAYYEGGPEQ